MKYFEYRKATLTIVTAFASIMLANCSSEGDSAAPAEEEEVAFVSAVFGECGSGMPVEVPCGFPIPREEENNPLSVEKIELGRLLFYDRNMSFNQTQSCADCHLPEKAFTDGLATSIGSMAHIHPRNAMSMTNVVYNGTMNWANNQIVNLDQQALAVLLNEDPIELGWSGHEDDMVARFKAPSAADYATTSFAPSVPDYPALFAAAFPDEADNTTMFTITKALAAFGAIMISGDSEFDKEQRGEPNSMTDEAKRGRDLFFDERFECFHCHGGFNFSDSIDHSAVQFTQNSFHNNGAFPVGDAGIREFTLLAEDDGKFRAPTLRNIALTGPYMHDGSIATLGDVVDHYASGGQVHPTKSSFINGFALGTVPFDERSDLIAFLESLTDWTFICNDALTDPFGVLDKNMMCP